MRTEKWPVLMWRDAHRGYCGCLPGGGDAAVAADATEEGVLRQLKEWVEADEASRQSPLAWGGKVEDWRLVEADVEIRPQRRIGDYAVPHLAASPVKVPCVVAPPKDGVCTAYLPHLSKSITFPADSEILPVVANLATQTLSAFDVYEFFGAIPPSGCYLRHVVIRRNVEPPEFAPEKRDELRVLFTLAEPIPYSLGRRRVGATAFGRESEVGRVLERLRAGEGTLLLVGESGIGKSTIVMDAARKMAREEKDHKERSNGNDRFMAALRVWRGSGMRMTAGMRFMGEWEKRCEEFIATLSRVRGIFWAESLLELVSAGGDGPEESVAAFLLPYLERKELRIIAEATPREWDACRRLMPQLLDVFSRIDVGRLPAQDEESVLRRIASSGGGDRRSFESGALKRVRELHSRFQAYAGFPGPSASLVRDLSEGRRLPPKSGGGAAGSITLEEVTSAFAKRTGMPEVFLRDDRLLPIGEVRDALARRVMGQPAAVMAAARLVTTFKAGVNDPQRPLGVLLFCGPTGVGKTALAKAVADFCFAQGSGDGDRLVRLDMSEYSGWGAARRFLTSDKGEPAAWLERVRRQPFCVVLFDEIEKAAPEIFDVLLTLLDEGRVTDSLGRVTWFRSAFIFLTSNLGADSGRSLGFGGGSEVDYTAAVAKFFRPEFFNRLDGVTPFRALGLEDVRGIVAKEFEDLGRREGLTESGLRLEWTDRLLNRIVELGFDVRFGARPLQRTLERVVVSPLSRWKVENVGIRGGVLRLDWTETDRVTIAWHPDDTEAGSQKL